MKRLAPVLAALVALFGLGGTAFAASAVSTSSTPGATDPATTQAVVCASGYAPASGISSATKRAIFAEYRVKKSRRKAYVIDHLVPVSLGGTSDSTNLWPQLRSQASSKDTQERAAQSLVCSGQVDLTTAQAAFTSDWTSSRATLQTAADAKKAQAAAYVKALEDAKKAQAIADYVAAQEAARIASEQAAAAAAAAAAQQQAQQQQASCPNGTYVNTAGNTVCSPYASASGPPAGATARCGDGTYSFSQSRSGTCSSHGGVAQWL